MSKRIHQRDAEEYSFIRHSFILLPLMQATQISSLEQKKYIFRVLKKDAEHVETIIAETQSVAEQTLKAKYPDSEILFLWERKSHITKSANPATKIIIILFFFSILFALAGLGLLYMRMGESKYPFYISLVFALAATLEIAGWEEIVVLSAGTDGTDGPTDAAGALADGETYRRAKAMGLDPWACLKENDSYPFFEKLGDLLITGPTGTNVMDLHIMMVQKKLARKSKRE